MPQQSGLPPTGEVMHVTDFTTSQETRELADEVACLKAMVTLMLKGMGQADAGKVIINMERYIAELGDQPQAQVFSNTIKQIKGAYRQWRIRQHAASHGTLMLAVDKSGPEFAVLITRFQHGFSLPKN